MVELDFVDSMPSDGVCTGISEVRSIANSQAVHASKKFWTWGKLWRELVAGVHFKNLLDLGVKLER